MEYGEYLTCDFDISSLHFVRIARIYLLYIIITTTMVVMSEFWMYNIQPSYQWELYQI
jgi:hypothetical protein